MSAALSVASITVAIGTKTLLDDVSLAFARGEIVAVVDVRRADDDMRPYAAAGSRVDRAMAGLIWSDRVCPIHSIRFRPKA